MLSVYFRTCLLAALPASRGWHAIARRVRQTMELLQNVVSKVNAMKSLSQIWTQFLKQTIFYCKYVAKRCSLGAINEFWFWWLGVLATSLILPTNRNMHSHECLQYMMICSNPAVVLIITSFSSLRPDSTCFDNCRLNLKSILSEVLVERNLFNKEKYLKQNMFVIWLMLTFFANFCVVFKRIPWPEAEIDGRQIQLRFPVNYKFCPTWSEV